MLKNILKLKDVQALTNTEQKDIKGGGIIFAICPPEEPVCADGTTNCREVQYYFTYCVNG